MLVAISISHSTKNLFERRDNKLFMAFADIADFLLDLDKSTSFRYKSGEWLRDVPLLQII